MPPKGPPKLTARERVLAEWRRVHFGPLEIARAKTERKIGEVMPEVLRRSRFAQRFEENEIRAVWNQVMAPEIIQHAQPVNLARGTLFVNVDNSVWLAELLQYRKKEILERLRHSFGSEKIKKIAFRIGS
jgi:predicted nucleic acid-binding Zn ribbon protein